MQKVGGLLECVDVVRRQKSGGIKILYVWVAGADPRLSYGNEKILSISTKMGWKLVLEVEAIICISICDDIVDMHCVLKSRLRLRLARASDRNPRCAENLSTFTVGLKTSSHGHIQFGVDLPGQAIVNMSSTQA